MVDRFMTSSKSDKPAKQAFIEELLRRGYVNPRVTAAPADITAEREGQTHYFEIKFTRRTKWYFGAATLTEWKAALANADRFRFVIAREIEGAWQFQEFTPEEFMELSSIPPFKIFFMVYFKSRRKRAEGSKTRGTVKLSREKLEELVRLYEKFRQDDKL